MPYPTISDDLYLANNEQASLACAAAFCFAHVEHNLIKHKLYNNWSGEFKQTNQIHNKKTNPKIIILEILVYKIQPEIIKSKIFTRFKDFRFYYFWLYFDPSTLESTIFTTLNEIRATGDLSADNLEYFVNKDPKFVTKNS